MKIKCDFCNETAFGSRDGLQMAGWVRAIFTSPKRVTISACPKHHREWGARINEIFTSAEVGGTEVPYFEDDEQ